MRFEWDPKKAQENRRKHGVSFEEAAECFGDELGMIIRDDAFPERLILLGVSKSSRLLFTVYVDVDDGDVIRIVSARRATRNERRNYEEGDF